MTSNEEFTTRLDDLLQKMPPGDQASKQLAASIVHHADTVRRVCTSVVDHRLRGRKLEAAQADFLTELEKLCDTELEHEHKEPPKQPAASDRGEMHELPSPQGEEHGEHNGPRFS